MIEETQKTDQLEPTTASPADNDVKDVAFIEAEDGASTVQEDNAWQTNDDAETLRLDLAAFSLTRDQVAEQYKAAGFDIQPRTVSDYGKRGILRAHKVPAKNGLMRYLFDPSSVEEDIDRRRREANEHDNPSTVHAPVSHHAPPKSERESDAADPAWIERRVHERDLKVARLETELQIERRERQKAEHRAEREAERAMALSHRVGQVQQQIDDYRVKIELLEAPRPEEAPTAPKKPASFLRRLFGRG